MISSRGGLWALVPVKRLSFAKKRLDNSIGPDQRVELSRAMLEDVLTALATTKGLAGVRLVTADTAIADIGHRFGAETTMDQCESGTSAAIEQGMASLPNNWGGVIAMPADIPFVTSAEIERVANALTDHSIVIVPAERDGGTNVLAMSASSRIELCFGPSSFSRHVAAAHAVHLKTTVVHLVGAGHDIDVAADLLSWPRQLGSGAKSARLLQLHHPKSTLQGQ